MKIPHSLVALGKQYAAPFAKRLGTAAGVLLGAYGATGEQVDALIGAGAVILGVGVDVLVIMWNNRKA